jgi:hypothetical protein
MLTLLFWIFIGGPLLVSGIVLLGLVSAALDPFRPTYRPLPWKTDPLWNPYRQRAHDGPDSLSARACVRRQRYGRAPWPPAPTAALPRVESAHG